MPGFGLGTVAQQGSAAIRNVATDSFDRGPGANSFDKSLGGIDEGISSLGDALGDGLNSAWDVLSGERDWRRNKEEAERNREFQEYMSNTEAQRRAADLAAAGINPVMAGSLQASTPSGSVAHGSNSQGAVSGAINSGISLLNGVTSLRKAMADIRKTNADADFVERSTPDNLKHLALTIPQIEANTAESVGRTHKLATEVDLNRLYADHQRARLPESQAIGDYYRQHGRQGVVAEKIRNPQQFAILGGSSTISDMMGSKALNSAADYLSEQVSRGVRNWKVLRDAGNDRIYRGARWVRDRFNAGNN